MLAAHSHPDQRLQPTHVKVVGDTEIVAIEGVDVMLTEKPTIAELVPAAMTMGEFRNQTIGTVCTVVFGHKMSECRKLQYKQWKQKRQ
jgi:hypothetical protein